MFERPTSAAEAARMGEVDRVAGWAREGLGGRFRAEDPDGTSVV
jgi:hypothetical protein